MARVLPQRFFAISAPQRPRNMRDNRRNDRAGGTFFVIRRFFPRDATRAPPNIPQRAVAVPSIPVAMKPKDNGAEDGAIRAIRRIRPLCRGLVIDGGLGELGQAFVGLLLFGERRVEQLHRFVVAACSPRPSACRSGRSRSARRPAPRRAGRHRARACRSNSSMISLPSSRMPLIASQVLPCGLADAVRTPSRAARPALRSRS